MIMLQQQPGIRLLNLHNTSESRRDELRRQIAACSRRFMPVSASDLAIYCRTGEWSGSKPGLLLAFYNGYRNNFSTAVPILEEFGMIGWFFVATDFISLPPDQQSRYCQTHALHGLAGEFADGRLALSPEELRLMSRYHEICSHTASHRVVFTDQTDPAELKREILGSAQQIESWTGQKPAAFCWLRGEQYATCPAAHPYMQQAGYRFLFGSRSIEYLSLPGT